MSGLLARVRSFWRGLRRPDRLEAEMEEEMRFHIEMEAQRLERERGLDAREALRQAAIAFGGVEKRKEEGRDARGLSWVTGLSLDFRLGLRLLHRYPALTMIGALAMAFAICVGSLSLRALILYTNPTLPLDGGDRVVGMQLWNAERNVPEENPSFAYARWREELRSIEQIGAFRDVQRNLSIGTGVPGPVLLAEISATAFPLARVPPLLGRTLIAADEQPGGPPVVVIGYRFWRERFDGDPAVVGRELRLDGVAHTVVGVMPEGFAFPVQHALWVPLRFDWRSYGPGEGPAIHAFGRLAPGASLRSAQAEIASLDSRLVAEYPAELPRLRSRVLPYPNSILVLEVGPGERRAFLLGYLLIAAFFGLICGNIALLLFARAATRQEELAVRSALGATRGRIVSQLFAEALVLAALAGVLGTVILEAGVGMWTSRAEAAPPAGGGLPFWFGGFLDARYLLSVAALTLSGAVLIGVLPALRVTGRRLEPRLRESAAGGPAYRFGGVWTVLIVAQVAVTVVVPALSFMVRSEIKRLQALELPIQAEEFLTARLELDQAEGGAASDARLQDRYAELERRLLGDPAVAGVSYTSALPYRYHPLARVELQEHQPPSGQPEPDYRVSSGMVDVHYFDVLGARILAGRGFAEADLAPGSRAVLVNRSFVTRILGGRNAVGLRFRFGNPYPPDDEPGEWHEIVGVAEDVGAGTNPISEAAFYRPLTAGASDGLYVAVHLRGDPRAFAQRLSALAAGVDPALRVEQIVPMDDLNDTGGWQYTLGLRLLSLLGAVALLLSLAAIYSVMSYAVSRRTREIGIRVALGADRRRIVAVVFRRPLMQMTSGIVLGAVAVAVLRFDGAEMSVMQAAGLALYATFMAGVCTLACIIPVRRALGIEPTEAMRES